MKKAIISLGLFLFLSTAAYAVTAPPSNVSVGLFREDGSADLFWDNNAAASQWFVYFNGDLKYSPTRQMISITGTSRVRFGMKGISVETMPVTITVKTLVPGSAVSAASTGVWLDSPSHVPAMYVVAAPGTVLAVSGSVSATFTGTISTTGGGTTVRATTITVASAVDGSSIQMQGTKDGKLIVEGSAPREKRSKAHIDITNTAETIAIAANPTGYNDITSLILSNQSSTEVLVTVRECQGCPFANQGPEVNLAPNGGGMAMNFSPPWPQKVSNAAWTLQLSTTPTGGGAKVHCYLQSVPNF